MEITTNNIPRDIIDAWELSDTERADFDYLAWDAIMSGEDSASFFRYGGTLYDLSEFMRVDDTVPSLKGWDGYLSDTYFSGIVVRYAEVDMDTMIVVGRFFTG